MAWGQLRLSVAYLRRKNYEKLEVHYQWEKVVHVEAFEERLVGAGARRSWMFRKSALAGTRDIIMQRIELVVATGVGRKGNIHA